MVLVGVSMCPGDLTSASILTAITRPSKSIGKRFNLEFRLFIQTVQNNNVYTVILCLKNIILLSQLNNLSNMCSCYVISW